MISAIIKTPKPDSIATKTWGRCPAAGLGWILEYPRLVKVVMLR